MKKLVFASAVAAAAVLAVSSAAFADTSSWNDDDIMPLLDSLGIMQGDGYGNYSLDRAVSRAEMAKISVNSSSHKNETAVGLSVSPFKDVDASSWSAPYILNGSNNGLFKGFVDGTFHPDDTVTYEEAITMMLRVLGYSDDTFGASYPYGQVNFAKNNKLLDNVEGTYGDTMTRRQIARLVYNTLEADMANSNSPLLSVFDAQIIEDVVIVDVPNGNGGKVTTSSGKYNAYNGFDSDYLGLSGDIVVKNSKDLLCFVPENNLNEKYVIYSVLNNTVIGYRNGSMSEVDLKDDTTCYKDSVKTTYSAIRNGMEMGDVLNVKYTSDGSVDYCIYETGNLEGPVKLASGTTGFAVDSQTQYMRDGNKVTSSSLQANDIAYYSKELNMVLAYSTKVSGIYQDASPSRDNPTSVVISGKTYEVEGVDAYNDLSSSGPLKFGDTITVCLGKDGKTVAGVVTSGTTSSTQYGYLIDAGKKNFDNSDGTQYSSYYVKIVTADAIEYEYAVKNNCSDYVGRVIKVSISSDGSSVSSVTSGGVSGKVNAEKRTIGSSKIADDCKILDIGGIGLADQPVYKKIYLQRLDGVNIVSGSYLVYGTAIYSHVNSSGEIDELILNEVTGDCYKYGMVTSVTSGESTRTCKVDIDGSVVTATATATGVIKGVPCKVRAYNNTYTAVAGLSKLGSYASNLTTTTVTVNGTEYKLSDEIAVYKSSGLLTYNAISINEAISGNYRISAYYDKAEDEGGRVRVLIAEEK